MGAWSYYDNDNDNVMDGMIEVWYLFCAKQKIDPDQDNVDDQDNVIRANARKYWTIVSSYCSKHQKHKAFCAGITFQAACIMSKKYGAGIPGSMPEGMPLGLIKRCERWVLSLQREEEKKYKLMQTEAIQAGMREILDGKKVSPNDNSPCKNWGDRVKALKHERRVLSKAIIGAKRYGNYKAVGKRTDRWW